MDFVPTEGSGPEEIAACIYRNKVYYYLESKPQKTKQKQKRILCRT